MVSPEDFPRATDAPRSEARPKRRLVARAQGRFLLFSPDEIDWIEAAGNYVRLNIGAQCHLLRETMASIEARLDPAAFLRIHRSVIVNLERIRELKPSGGGEYVVVLRDGTELTLSRGYRAKLPEILGEPV